jgi:predicted O-methyltransferase YrrM
MIQHFYQDIEGWFDFEDLYREAVRRMPDGGLPESSQMIEVGVYKGRSCFFLAVEAVNSGKAIQICAVDKFDHPHAMRDFDAIRTAHDLRNTVHMFVAPSVEAARHFQNGSLDFVFLDADHTYESVKADLAAWWPKVRPGGILAGHDFASEFPGVEQAVRERFPKKGAFRLFPPRSWWVDKAG